MPRLVLTRRRDEIISIGDNIEVMVVDVKGDRVRIAVDAPIDIPIDRKEIRLAKQTNPKP